MGDTKVEAMVRVRPFNRRELEKVRAEHGGETKTIVSMNGRRVALLDPNRNYQEAEAFDFDEAFWSIPKEQMMAGGLDLDDPAMMAVAKQMGIDHVVSQQEVYEKTGARCVQHAFEGFHSCIFAYGQTGAGKTYTMMGGLDDKGGLDDSPKGKLNRGVCLRLVEDLFFRINRLKEQGENTNFHVLLSFMEIYKEKCKDLLVKAGRKKTGAEEEKDYQELKVRQSPSEGTYVSGLERKEIRSAEHCFTLMAYGMTCRHTAATKMNDVSSRSHAIFQITFKQQDPLRGVNTLSNINLVDLAGSERIKDSGATEGERRAEAVMINKSLSTLRRVIDVLVDNAKKKGKGDIPPYRESMLTRVLQESLGGNSKTIMIAAVSPFAGNYEDTLNTLRYANKAKDIVCKTKRNDEKGQMIVSAMRNEMDRLKAELAQKTEEMDDAARAQLEQDLIEHERQLRAAEEQDALLREQQEQILRAHSELAEGAKAEGEALQELRAKEEEAKELANRRIRMEREAEEYRRREAEAVKRNKATAEGLRAQQEHLARMEREQQELRAKSEETQREMREAKQRTLAAAFKNALVLWRDTVQAEALDRKMAELAAQLGPLQRRLQEERATAETLVAEREAAEEGLASARDAIKQLRAEHEEESKRTKARLEQAAAQKREADERNAELDTAIAAAEQKLESLAQRRADSDRALQRRLGLLSAEAREAQAEVADEERAVEAARRRASQAQRSIADLQQEYDQLAEESRRITLECAAAEQRLQSAAQRRAALHRTAAQTAEALAATGRLRTETEAQIALSHRHADRSPRLFASAAGDAPQQPLAVGSTSPQHRWQLRSFSHPDAKVCAGPPPEMYF